EAVINFFGTREELRKLRFELIRWVGFIGPENLLRALDSVAFPFPHFAGQITAADEKRHSISALAFGRRQHEKRLRLVKAAQIIKIALQAEREGHIRIPQNFLSRRQDEHRPRIGFHQFFPTSREKRGNLRKKHIRSYFLCVATLPLVDLRVQG